MIPPGNTVIPLNWKFTILANHFGDPHAIESTYKEENNYFLLVTSPDYQGKVLLLFHTEVRPSMSVMALLLPGLLTYINGKLQ